MEGPRKLLAMTDIFCTVVGESQENASRPLKVSRLLKFIISSCCFQRSSDSLSLYQSSSYLVTFLLTYLILVFQNLCKFLTLADSSFQRFWDMWLTVTGFWPLWYVEGHRREDGIELLTHSGVDPQRKGCWTNSTYATLSHRYCKYFSHIINFFFFFLTCKGSKGA